MRLGTVLEALNEMKDKGMSLDTPVFVPQEKEQAIEHVEAEILVVNLSEGEEENYGIIFVPYDTNYYDYETVDELSEESDKPDNLSKD